MQATTYWIAGTGDLNQANKILGEEDKCAISVARTSQATNLPFDMARWYLMGLDCQVSVDFDMEYVSKRPFLNGVEESDRFIITDDMICTGETILAGIQPI
jgi:adenine/guanine phosphoribosyltransferase-like PRPP-binding protein